MQLEISILLIPQFLIQGILHLAASLILPLTTPELLTAHCACGGLIMLATGLRIKRYQAVSHRQHDSGTLLGHAPVLALVHRPWLMATGDRRPRYCSVRTVTFFLSTDDLCQKE